MGEDLIAALTEDFAKHGRGAIETVRQDRPAAYLNLMLHPVAFLITQSISRDLLRNPDRLFGSGFLLRHYSRNSESLPGCR